MNPQQAVQIALRPSACRLDLAELSLGVAQRDLEVTGIDLRQEIAGRDLGANIHRSLDQRAPDSKRQIHLLSCARPAWQGRLGELGGIPDQDRTDRARLRRLLVNLLGTAVKAVECDNEQSANE